MFIFGHMGFGAAMARPWANPFRKLSFGMILLGTVLPDLIDKTLYYSLSFWTGKSGPALGLICGTRTFGHTLLFFTTIAASAAIFKNRWLASLAVGIFTHLFLDTIPEMIYFGSSKITISPWLWPFATRTFPSYPFTGIGEHFEKIRNPYFYCAEFIGLGLLIYVRGKMRNRKVIAEICPVRLDSSAQKTD
jgi:membrane-bound metal-dependent hydrolase YbcI (DUF457 family)